jgi:hypothetical protein
MKHWDKQGTLNNTQLKYTFTVHVNQIKLVYELASKKSKNAHSFPMWIWSEILCLVSWPDLRWNFARKPLVKPCIHFKFNYKHNGIFTWIGQAFSCSLLEAIGGRSTVRQGQKWFATSKRPGKSKDRGYTSQLEFRRVAEEGGTRYNDYTMQAIPGNPRQPQATPGNTRQHQAIPDNR